VLNVLFTKFAKLKKTYIMLNTFSRLLIIGEPAIWNAGPGNERGPRGRTGEPADLNNSHTLKIIL